ncbi:DegT/DnrJ/EryC1/StrS family aminotransferase [Thermus albus]|uniref:DegT/DnrJ/EryC1/StrS family aminotransferase n=1 Tax=Thermus albus TaxID=2908146 RepID=UPI001FAB182E|nr:DegT/DnrJ/EryC1/StrS family aminotransferase [Thermus albus]
MEGIKGRIPILDLTPEVEELWDHLMAAITRVLRSGQFILGPEVEAFEREVAEYLGVRHAIGVNSGTDALVIGLRALGIGPGDEVITTPFTFFATAEAISLVGATPVFVDIDPKTFNINPELIPAAITPRTKAILPVHLYGCPADMDPILALAEEHGLKVLEDSAQAFGATYRGRKVGTLGHAGAFSFFPSKNLGAYGDGGLLVTNDDGVAEVARMLRAHGSRRKYHNEMVGYNSRLDALQAAILRVKLPHVDRWNAQRREVASRYNQLLAGIPGVVVPEISEGHVFHQYTVRILGGRRDEVQKALAEAGIGTMVYYPVPLHLLPVYGYPEGILPMAEGAAKEALSMPMFPNLSPGLLAKVVQHIKELLLE